MSRSDLQVGLYVAAIVGVIGFGAYVDATEEDPPPEPVPAYIQYGDPDQPVYEREWGK